MFLIVSFLWVFIYHAHEIMSLECEYSSREYQVVLRPDLLTNSFETGVMRILDELTMIEKTQTIPFSVSRSSLKFKNVTRVQYIPSSDRALEDFNISPGFKSRRKKITEPADIAMKFSNTDPALSCIPLTVANKYVNMTKVKFELDAYGENGRIITKSAHSFTTDLPLEFNQTSAINISSIFTDVAAKITYSGQSIIIVPDSVGKFTVKTAEFNVHLAGQKVEATITYYRRSDNVKAEFSFRIKGTTVQREILLASQQITVQLSQKTAIALYAIIQPRG